MVSDADGLDQRVDELIESWKALSPKEYEEHFLALDKITAQEFFLCLSSTDQAHVFTFLPPKFRTSLAKLLPLDDLVDLLQELSPEEKNELITSLDNWTKTEVNALLAYKEDVAGGLMNSRYARLRADMTVEEALKYLRAQTQANLETIYYAYVIDSNQILVGALTLRELFTAKGNESINNIMTMRPNLITIPENIEQEEMAKIFAETEHLALPVVDDSGKMKGVITIDDVVDVLEEEATEDFQKIGGMEALEEPYLKVHFFEMFKKRAGWLVVLFAGETLTASAMTHFEDQIAKAVLLALFIPLIISSGGNSGSQASTLIVRALALDEVRLKDWWRVFVRETFSGLLLGLFLGIIGIMRVFFWPNKESLYGHHYGLVSLTVGVSLIGVVMLGTLTGSMLPFILKRFKLDPAVASAPFVATIVDVTGLVIYFSAAKLFLSGILL
ncbi:MAG: magnesium transporter [Bdellovibrionales bacterium RIFOXYD12_FULL_39_22]|nr:MAG: magnesium transporter [Bdellovibrionales bacterium RIFOXYB1_FULL_39_21]OFZ44522.1 MAG: magnesium transporter [Bdellovibrionales bacterium RIFOXYC12_FULL_39_17]OFZ49836.1 MAG: magnesium transporter [Bdellovibrionales bacterium RIFOXYC1_FULL_39_130]OFZ76841.1 MAG: magnesium transporter [Bdellovibrionales bacterium RIFOXYD1_FULL_39_84]OFZ95768.1 MAG: magnesium transporter [Bdellovibrionales bacterium RIFOXYD12_FULL_39_22]HLE10786.1 magnesium transporter [Bacteriovoracaceae bacterium]